MQNQALYVAQSPAPSRPLPIAWPTGAMLLALSIMCSPAHAADTGREAAIAAAQAAAQAAEDAVSAYKLNYLNATQVALRAAPNTQAAVLLRLKYAEAVTVITQSPSDGFCGVRASRNDNANDKRSDPTSNGFTEGWVACRYLSAQPPPLTDAPAERVRYIAGAGVNVRAEASISAAKLATLAINKKVVLAATTAASLSKLNGAFCALDWPKVDAAGVKAAASGVAYVACSFLSDKPVTDASLEGLGVADNASQTERAKAGLISTERSFFLKPSLPNMLSYAAALEMEQSAKTAVNSADTPVSYPRNATLEAMKNTLKNGVIAPQAPVNYPNWPTWQSVVSSARKIANCKDGIRVCHPWKTEEVALNEIIVGYSSQVFPASSANGKQVQHSGDPADNWPASTPYALLSSIILPDAKPSFFTQRDVVTTALGAEDLSAAFQIPVISKISRAREVATNNSDADWDKTYGVWDINKVEQSLSRPVTKHNIYSNGKVQSQSSNALANELATNPLSEEMCAGFRYGFSYGEPEDVFFVQPSVVDPDAKNSRKKGAPNLEFSFYSKLPLNLDSNPPIMKSSRLNLTQTGFERQSTASFDFNGDGIADMVQIKLSSTLYYGLHGNSKSEPWLRITLFNFAGQWHVFGVDSYAYGCGC